MQQGLSSHLSVTRLGLGIGGTTGACQRSAEVHTMDHLIRLPGLHSVYASIWRVAETAPQLLHRVCNPFQGCTDGLDSIQQAVVWLRVKCLFYSLLFYIEQWRQYATSYPNMTVQPFIHPSIPRSMSTS